MKALVVVFAAVGGLVGLGVGVLEHQRSTAANTGWTFYLPVQRQYADYLPTEGARWWPGLAAYVGVGVAGGAVIAGVLLAGGFRLFRLRRGGSSAGKLP